MTRAAVNNVVDLPARPVNPHALWDKLGLMRNGRGDPYPNLANAVRILRQHESLRGRFTYDEFTGQCLARLNGSSADVTELTDYATLRVTRYIQDELGIARISDDVVDKAIVIVSREKPSNSVRDWLESLSWDGMHRLPLLLPVGFGAREDSDFVVRVGRNFLISLVARAYAPGCKADHMLVIEGLQGAMKSSAFSVLGGPWYAELHETVGSREFLFALRGLWLVELSELAGLTRADVEKLKATLSTQNDRYRTPYGRHAEDHPRRCVFVGTTNEDTYLRDTTGARRFWPVRCGQINLEWLRDNREQLFAEAVAAYKAGAPWWEVPAEEAATEQEARRQADPWEAIIADWLIGKNDCTVREVLDDCLKIEAGRQDRAAQMRVGSVLRSFGWEKFQRGTNRDKAWRRPL